MRVSSDPPARFNPPARWYRRRYLMIVILLSVCAARTRAQSPPDSSRPQTKSIVAGARYKASGFHEFWFGAHWRMLWTAPIEAQVLDLKTYAGGLTPVKRGGGNQSKSLRFKGADGKEYKFRSLDKAANVKMLPKDIQESVAADVLQDQICSSHPLSVLVAAPLLEAVGVLNAEPTVAIITDSAGLGAFADVFYNIPGTIELNPTAPKKNKGDEKTPDENAPDEKVSEEDAEGFGGADKIADSYKFFRKLDEDNDNRVDAADFLKARLTDLFIGDWDRHIDQWRWAGYDEGKAMRWRVIPRDRDHAFDRFDGVFPWLAEQVSPPLKGFTPTYPLIRDATSAARYLDRRLLGSVDRRTWDSVTVWMLAQWTDSVLVNAVKKLPPEMVRLEGKSMEDILKARRDRFRQMSNDFYAFSASHPELTASDKAEVIDVVRLGGGRVEVSFYKRDKKTGGKKSDAFYRRTFEPQETSEVRLFLLGGDDSVSVSDRSDSDGGRITVRVIGGGGQDAFVQAESGGGWFGGAKTLFYDTEPNTILASNLGATVDADSARAPANDDEKYHPVPDFGGETIAGIGNTWFNYVQDYGLFLGWGAVHNVYGFRHQPYASRLEVRAGYAFEASRAAAEFKGDFRALIKNGRVLIDAATTGLTLLNFYGFGNETVRLEENDVLPNQPQQRVGGNFYRSAQQLYTADVRLELPLTGSFNAAMTASAAAPNAIVAAGASLKYVSLDGDDTENFLPTVRPYGIDNRFIAVLHAGIKFDTRKGKLNPQQGVLIDAAGEYAPELGSIQKSFGRVRGDARVYLPLPVPSSVLAMRATGEKLWGTFPFYESAFLGGLGSVRGLDIQRFAGDAMAMGSVEARLMLGKVRLLVPLSVGVSTFGETGRVFLTGETSSRWHGAGGGGVWLSAIDPEFLLSISLARSEELFGLYITGGFSF